MSTESTASFASPFHRDRSENEACLMLVVQSGQLLTAPLVFPFTYLRELQLRRSASRETRASVAGDTLVLEIADSWLSSPHARLVREPLGVWRLHDLGSKNGSYVNGVRVGSAVIDDGDVIDVGFSFLSLKMNVPKPLLTELEHAAIRGEAVATLCPEVYVMHRELERIAESRLAVLLSGETGTGKELAAQRVHVASGRKGPFVAVNCAAIAGSLAESELFGFVRGAFSGANEDRQGLVRASHAGTLFLDEVADLDLAIQSKLLRALQEEEVLPVGSTRPVRVDLRVISASCRDLDALVTSGAFREDLFARLAGHRVMLPPLRERREDLSPLIANLLRESLAERAAEVRIQREVLRAFYQYDWPRNIRQLRNAVQAALALSKSLELGLEHLPAELRHFEQAEAEAESAPAVDDPLREQLLLLLTQHRGNVSAIARTLGKARVQVRRWCQRFGLDPDAFRESS